MHFVTQFKIHKTSQVETEVSGNRLSLRPRPWKMLRPCIWPTNWTEIEKCIGPNNWKLQQQHRSHPRFLKTATWASTATFGKECTKWQLSWYHKSWTCFSVGFEGIIDVSAQKITMFSSSFAPSSRNVTILTSLSFVLNPLMLTCLRVFRDSQMATAGIPSRCPRQSLINPEYRLRTQSVELSNNL